MKISELSKATGVSQRMLRYFEQIGLLNPERTEGDYRVYGDEDRKRILEIREWQRLGLTLKEIAEFLRHPESATELLENVFLREREAFLEKQRAIQDLRERFTGKKYPYFETRVAYSIPNADKVLRDMSSRGWKNKIFDYQRFSEWHDEARTGRFLVGEMIWQSSFYLLFANDQTGDGQLERFMAHFCQVANKSWPAFDGHPPQAVDFEDLREFFAPTDVIVHLEFQSDALNELGLVLPYQSVFALAKAADRRRR